MSDKQNKHEILTLKNGLRVVFFQKQEYSPVTVAIAAGVGSMYEDDSNNGISHFLEHMLFKGTDKRRAPDILLKELDLIGAKYNAYTSKDRTVYYLTVEPNQITKGLDILSDMYLNSRFPQKEIEKEKGAIIEEINMYEDMPMQMIDDVFEEAYFGANTPLGRTILGPKQNIKAMTRKQFLDYYQNHYTAENTVVAVSGYFDKEKVLKQLTKLFKNAPHAQKTTPTQESFQVQKIKIKHKQTDQTHIMLGVPAISPDEKDYYAQAVLNTILGSGMSSRLFSEVREKRGLAYAIHSAVTVHQSIAYLYVYAGVSHNKTQEALQTIREQMLKLAKTGPKDEELKKAKRQFKTSLLIKQEASSSKALSLASQLVVRGKITTDEEIAKKISKVTKDQVKSLAKKLLTQQPTLAVIGPHKNEQLLLKALQASS